jgi:hypothetical protein
MNLGEDDRSLILPGRHSGRIIYKKQSEEIMKAIAMQPATLLSFQTVTTPQKYD